MCRIFFDFDGTLANSLIRLYKLFCELCPENAFSYEEYWNIKRNRVTQKDFLANYFHFDEDRIARFHKEWLLKVEEKDRVLNEDIPVEGIDSVLRNLSETHTLYLITNRQSVEITKEQLKKIGWFVFFEKILVTEQKKSASELIRAEVSNIRSEDCFVGDTGEDIKTAKEFGAKSVAVTWGVISRDVLQTYVPDKIVDTVGELKKHFKI